MKQFKIHIFRFFCGTDFIHFFETNIAYLVHHTGYVNLASNYGTATW